MEHKREELLGMLHEATGHVLAGTLSITHDDGINLMGLFLKDRRDSKERRKSMKGLMTLSEREREILVLVGRGYQNKQIGAELWITVQTVKFHLTNIYRKLNVPNRTAAVRVGHDYEVLLLKSGSRSSGRQPQSSHSSSNHTAVA